MDIVKYQRERDAQLASFQEQYQQLQQTYRSLLSDAIYEQDPATQSELVQQILHVNSELAASVRSFLASPTEDYDQTVVDSITKDLVAYQQQYAHMQRMTDTTRTLQSILDQTQSNLREVRFQYSIFIGGLLLAILVLLVLILRTPSATFLSTAKEALTSSLPTSPA
jgi:hypothetical protein